MINNHKKCERYHQLLHTAKLTFYQTHMRLEKIGLYRGQPPLLFVLWHKDGRSRKELCDTLGLRPATITKMIKRLEKSDFVFSKQDMDDSRVSRVYLTSKGKEIQDQVEKTYEELDELTFRDFTEEEKETLSYLLAKIRKNLKGTETEIR